MLGCIRVSWFSETSPKVFNQMRFLVSETADVDLVIGTRSIQKEKLLNPPNFMLEQKIHDLAQPSGKSTCDADGIAVPLIQADPERESLVGNVAALQTDKLNVEERVEKIKEGTKERASAEKTLKKAKNALKMATWKLELYDVGLDLQKKHSEKTQRALMDRKKGLQAKLAGKEKKEK